MKSYGNQLQIIWMKGISLAYTVCWRNSGTWIPHLLM